MALHDFISTRRWSLACLTALNLFPPQGFVPSNVFVDDI